MKTSHMPLLLHSYSASYYLHSTAGLKVLHHQKKLQTLNTQIRSVMRIIYFVISFIFISTRAVDVTQRRSKREPFTYTPPGATAKVTAAPEADTTHLHTETISEPGANDGKELVVTDKRETKKYSPDVRREGGATSTPFATSTVTNDELHDDDEWDEDRKCGFLCWLSKVKDNLSRLLNLDL